MRHHQAAGTTATHGAISHPKRSIQRGVTKRARAGRWQGLAGDQSRARRRTPDAAAQRAGRRFWADRAGARRAARGATIAADCERRDLRSLLIISMIRFR